MPRNSAFHSMASVKTHETQTIRYMEILKKIAFSASTDVRLFDALQSAALKATERKKEANVHESKFHLSTETIDDLKKMANARPTKKKMTEHFLPIENAFPVASQFGPIVPPEEPFSAIEDPASVVDRSEMIEEPRIHAEDKVEEPPEWVFNTEGLVEETTPDEELVVEEPVEETTPDEELVVGEPVEETTPDEELVVEEPVEETTPEEQLVVEEPVEETTPEEQLVVEEPVEETTPEEELVVEEPVEETTDEEVVVEEPVEEPTIIKNVVSFENDLVRDVIRPLSIVPTHKRKFTQLYEGQKVSILFDRKYYTAKLGKSVPAGRRIHYSSGHDEVAPDEEISARIK
jgi:hypothetical protein